MKKIIQLKEYNSEIKRDPPLNFNQKDENLFLHEFHHQIGTGLIKRLNNKIVNADFIVFSSFGFEQQSFQYREHFKPKGISAIKFLLKNLLFNPKIKVSKGIWITDAWSSGYFHWFGDVLQKIFILKSNNILTDEHILLLPQEMKNYDYVYESLKLLGIKVNYLEKDLLMHCHELVTIEFPFQSGNYYEELIKEMNAFFRESDHIPDKISKNVYLSRKKATRRQVINDIDLINSFNNENIQTLYAEDLSWKEQVETFKNVELLISIHGAGLTNMLFMKPGSIIIEFRHPKSDKQNCFFSLASALGHKYYYVIGESDDDDSHVADIKINFENIRLILDEI